MVRGRWTRSIVVGALLVLATSGCAWVERASVGSDGNQANGPSVLFVATSADGRYVAFTSTATNLVPDPTNGTPHVFVRDTRQETTALVSVDSDGNLANAISVAFAISGDGRYVVFASVATNLVAGDTNGVADVFVRDMVAETTTRASVDSDGNEANGLSNFSAISADGRYVAFQSEASNLVSGDTNGDDDVFVRDIVNETTTRVSLDIAGGEANNHSRSPAISADGRYVAFASEASNLVTGDTNGAQDVFVRDTTAGTTTRASVDSDGNQANGLSESPAISADGRYVAFESLASNLVSDDTNGQQDVIVRANPQPTVTELAPASLARATTTPVTVTGSGFIDGGLGLVVTGNGGGVTFSNITVISPTEITADATVAAEANVGARDLSVLLLGTGPGLDAGASGICVSCLTVT